MKIIFSSIKNNDIFETDFAHLSSQNGTIEFKHMQGSGGIAVIYAPNGTGKTSLANLLDVEVSTEKNSFVASDDQGNTITPETMAFHVIQDQLNRNVIRGKTTDYLIGAQIRREYELRDQINAAFRNAYEQLSSKYKAEFKVSKVGDYLLTQIESVQDTTHQTAFQYIRSIVNTRQHGKDIDRNTFVAFIRNDENRPNLSEMDTTKRSFIITDLSKSKVVEKILAIKPDEIIADTSSVLVERHDDAIGILKKYHSLESCIVCDNHSFDGDALLESKKEREFINGLLEHYQPTDAQDVQEMLKDLLGDTLQGMLEAEMDQKLGYSKYDYQNKETDDSRNGYSHKTVTSSMGDIDLDIPRDRRGEFEPQIVKKHQTDISSSQNISCTKCLSL